jgi:choline dehydrogenase-like flavoprotein
VLSPADFSTQAAGASTKSIVEPVREVPVCDSADVIVCGAGPAGAMAAIAAGRAGAKTVLLEAHGSLGGIWTSGLLSWVLDYKNKAGQMKELVKAALRAEIERAGRAPSYAGASLFRVREGLFILMSNHAYGVKATISAIYRRRRWKPGASCTSRWPSCAVWADRGRMCAWWPRRNRLACAKAGASTGFTR